MGNRRAAYRQFHVFYKTTCKITGKYYLGIHSTDKLDDGYIGSGFRLRSSVKKYGKENHIYEIVKLFDDRKSLVEHERNEVTPEKIQDPNCMNLALGGLDPMWGRNHSSETREKMRQSALGRNVPDETKQKISETLAKRFKENPSETHLASIEKWKIARLGKTNSGDHRQKISEANKGRVVTEETRRKIAQTLKGRKQSPDVGRRLSKALTGRVFSEEHRKKLSEAWDRRRSRKATHA